MGIFRKNKQEPPIRNPRIVDQNDDYAFRRSRTLTGSASSDVAAATESRGRLKSARLKEHELRSHRKKIAGYLLTSLMVLVGLVWLISQFVWGVSKTIPADTVPKKPVDAADYTRLVDEYFHTRPLERFSFALREDDLKRYIQQAKPEVKDISLSAEGIMKHNLVVDYRQPIIVWQINGETYYVDSEGVAFKQNLFAAPSLTVKDNSGVPPASSAIASSRILRFIGRVVTLVNESNVAEVSEVIMPLNMTREIDLKLKGRPYVVKTQLDRDPAGQAADVINAVRYFDKKGDKPKYVDVRVSSQAFYR